mgnify:CR=1 FL=1
MRTSILVQAAIIGLLAAPIGCASSPKAPPGQTQTAGATAAERLFAAVVAGYEAEGIAVAIAQPDAGVVISPWVELNSELRRRYVSRVVSVGQGLVFRVIAEFERRDRTGPTPVWTPADDPLTAQRAKREEATLGAAIQNAYGRRAK